MNRKKDFLDLEHKYKVHNQNIVRKNILWIKNYNKLVCIKKIKKLNNIYKNIVYKIK